MLLNQTAPLLSGLAQDINDSQPGSSFTSPTGGQIYAGILGQAWQWNDAQALLHSNTAKSTLFGGIYQYVQFKTGSTGANALGQLVFYAAAADRASFIVTPDPTTSLAQVAGVTVGAPSKGNFGIIQIAGLAQVLCKAAVTDTTAGDIGFAVSDSSLGKVDAQTPGSATAAQQAVKVGWFLDAPVAGAVKRLYIQPSLFINCY